MLGDVSNDPLVSLDHIDQGNGTQYKQGHIEWTALLYTSFNIDFACRVSIQYDLACYVFAQHPCQFKKITLKAKSLHRHEQVFMIDMIEVLAWSIKTKNPFIEWSLYNARLLMTSVILRPLIPHFCSIGTILSKTFDILFVRILLSIL